MITRQFELDHWGVAALKLIRTLDASQLTKVGQRRSAVRALFAMAKASGDISTGYDETCAGIFTDAKGKQWLELTYAPAGRRPANPGTLPLPFNKGELVAPGLASRLMGKEQAL